MNLKLFRQKLSPQVIAVSLKWNVSDRYFSVFQRSRLHNRNFSIICNNCLAGSIYHKYGLPYTSPTIGLYFYSEDYLRFIENFQYYINQPLTFREKSIYPNVNILMKNTWRFPVGVLGRDVEIEFLHYKNKEEAKQKWERRCKRIDFDNLYFMFSDSGAAGGGSEMYDFKEEYLERFEALPYANKVFFSSKDRQGRSVVYIEEYENLPFVDNMVVNRKYEKYFDVKAWLNRNTEMQVNHGQRAQVLNKDEQSSMPTTLKQA